MVYGPTVPTYPIIRVAHTHTYIYRSVFILDMYLYNMCVYIFLCYCAGCYYIILLLLYIGGGVASRRGRGDGGGVGGDKISAAHKTHPESRPDRVAATVRTDKSIGIMCAVHTQGMYTHTHTRARTYNVH
jgi:hypothetical protein